VQRAALREKFGIPHDAFVGVFLARWGLDKAVDVLEDVMAKTPEVFWLLVLGTGAPCPLQQSATVRILEGLAPQEVAETLSLANFLFHPARYEGFGLAIVEALACGLPVIAAPVGVMRMIGKEQPFLSLLLPSYTERREDVINEAVTAIVRLRREKDLALAYHVAGPAFIKEHFDHRRWETAMLATLGVSI
jgi:hypothetical protein